MPGSKWVLWRLLNEQQKVDPWIIRRHCTYRQWIPHGKKLTMKIVCRFRQKSAELTFGELGAMVQGSISVVTRWLGKSSGSKRRLIGSSNGGEENTAGLPLDLYVIGGAVFFSPLLALEIVK